MEVGRLEFLVGGRTEGCPPLSMVEFGALPGLWGGGGWEGLTIEFWRGRGGRGGRERREADSSFL